MREIGLMLLPKEDLFLPEFKFLYSFLQLKPYFRDKFSSCRSFKVVSSRSFINIYIVPTKETINRQSDIPVKIFLSVCRNGLVINDLEIGFDRNSVPHHTEIASVLINASSKVIGFGMTADPSLWTA